MLDGEKLQAVTAEPALTPMAPAPGDRRSLRAEVRNPLLSLPAARKLAAQPPQVRALLRELLLELRDDARVRADLAFRKHKWPMAVYWKAVGVYANHAARLFSPVALVVAAA